MCLSALKGFAVHSSDELCRQQCTVGQGSKEVAWLPKEEPSRPRAQPVQRPRGRSVLVCLLKAWPGGLWLGGSGGEVKVLVGRAEMWEWGSSSDRVRPSKGFSLHGERDEEPLRSSEERGHDLP